MSGHFQHFISNIIVSYWRILWIADLWMTDFGVLYVPPAPGRCSMGIGSEEQWAERVNILTTLNHLTIFTSTILTILTASLAAAVVASRQSNIPYVPSSQHVCMGAMYEHTNMTGLEFEEQVTYILHDMLHSTAETCGLIRLARFIGLNVWTILDPLRCPPICLVYPTSQRVLDSLLSCDRRENIEVSNYPGLIFCLPLFRSSSRLTAYLCMHGHSSIS
ncbi:hypothetical protein F4806DRAFT_309325 [Annulohypoxylon nitens]|nr:hypothetical protein F4806DRAFT_309325 [Annulohypoxylon nitens]